MYHNHSYVKTNSTNHVTSDICPCCDEPIGTRMAVEITKAKSTFKVIAHKVKCADQLVETYAADDAALAKKEQEVFEAKADREREERIAKRGPLEDFINRKNEIDDDDERRVQSVLFNIVHSEERCNEKIAEFAKRLANNPHEAFRWAEDAVDSSAKLVVNEAMLHAFKKGATRQEMLDTALEQTFTGCRDGHSTSPCSNLVGAATTKAWATITQCLQGGRYATWY